MHHISHLKHATPAAYYQFKFGSRSKPSYFVIVLDIGPLHANEDLGSLPSSIRCETVTKRDLKVALA